MVVVVALFVTWYYNSNNNRIHSQIRLYVSGALKHEMAVEGNTPPETILATVPASSIDINHIFLISADRKYRVILADDPRIRTQVLGRFLSDVFQPEQTQIPMFKLSHFALSNYGLNDDQVIGEVEVQYVSPFGIIRTMDISTIVPLKHWTIP